MSEQVIMYIVEIIAWMVSIYIGYLVYNKFKEKYKRPLEKFPDLRPYFIGVTAGFAALVVLYLLTAAFIIWAGAV